MRINNQLMEANAGQCFFACALINLAPRSFTRLMTLRRPILLGLLFRPLPEQKKSKHHWREFQVVAIHLCLLFRWLLLENSLGSKHSG